MKHYISDFFRRGLLACGLGPLVLAVFYLILRQTAAVETLTVAQVCTGIFSLTALAFIAGGMNVLYQIERLPLMTAILIHGAVLYISYLVTFLLNGWLDRSAAPLVIFSFIFILGYLAIWAIIYSVTKKDTARLNRLLQQKQQSDEAAG